MNKKGLVEEGVLVLNGGQLREWRKLILRDEELNEELRGLKKSILNNIDNMNLLQEQIMRLEVVVELLANKYKDLKSRIQR